MRALWFLLLGLLGHSLTWAGTPEWVKELTPGTAGTQRRVPPCRLTFDVGWSHVMTAGQATLTVREAGAFWRADASAASTGLARALWKYDCEMTSIMHRGDLRAHYLQHQETDSAETCRYRVSFERHRVITETQVQPVKGAKATSTAVCPYGPMDDILSFILYVRSLELKNGQKITRVVQPWDTPYLTTFEVQGRETIEYGGQKRPCIKLGLKIRKIDRNTLALSAYKKMKTATIWVSDDELRIPIEMNASVFVGFMFARLTQFETLTGKHATASLPASITVKPPPPPAP
ncbi:DUF3108 domain-containing protein [Prosthecobacter sp.]|uniref:DUF3108 domain-containing protein n=1 Tax=Prosthecobacter sp. TaxID=1965333 RepID=UPI0037845A41